MFKISELRLLDETLNQRYTGSLSAEDVSAVPIRNTGLY